MNQCGAGENLIAAADDGTFGTFPAGTPANTGVPEEPYPGVTPDFTYVLPNPEAFAPFGGEYTVQNLMPKCKEPCGKCGKIGIRASG